MLATTQLDGALHSLAHDRAAIERARGPRRGRRARAREAALLERGGSRGSCRAAAFGGRRRDGAPDEARWRVLSGRSTVLPRLARRARCSECSRLPGASDEDVARSSCADARPSRRASGGRGPTSADARRGRLRGKMRRGITVERAPREAATCIGLRAASGDCARPTGYAALEPRSRRRHEAVRARGRLRGRGASPRARRWWHDAAAPLRSSTAGYERSCGRRRRATRRSGRPRAALRWAS